jgi:hypothetical protein
VSSRAQEYLLPELLGLAASLLPIAANADAATQFVFVGCPIYRDTNAGRKSGCWLVTDEASGIRYDVSQSRTKPQRGHEILVEGRLASSSSVEAEKGTPCGGVTLAPVVVSVLDSLCPSYSVPAENYPGRRFRVDPRFVLQPADVPEALPAPPFGPRSWHIEFAFESDFLQYQYSEVLLDEIGRYVRASPVRLIEVTGYAVTTPRLVSGHRLAEQPELARTRADMVALALERLGASPSILKVRTRENPARLAGDDELSEPSRRRVDIRLTY